MFFTQEDYRKIEDFLKRKSIKDTQFDEAITPLDGEEEIAFVQNGKNVKAHVKDIVEQLFLLGVSDFVNITDKYNQSYIDIREAIQLIPFYSRKSGQVITFIDKNGNWVIYQFKGHNTLQWNNINLWSNLFESIYINSILPDEEDLTRTSIDEHGNSKLKFKDKVYSSENFSGLGRVYLRKNIIDGKNLLLQEMIFNSNSIYHIQYDYDLNGQELIIPSNCILQFDGGSVNNGTLRGDNTKIFSINNDFIINVNLTGTWDINECYSEWFGAKGDGITDDRKAIQTALDLHPNILYLEPKTYYLSTTKGGSIYNANLLLPPSISIIGNNTKILRSPDSQRGIEGCVYRGPVIHITKNVSLGDIEISVYTVDGINIGDKVLLIGEDGINDDKAEPSAWMYNYIDDIKGNVVVLRRPIPFNIDLNKCNTVGSVSTAVNNGSISVVKDGTIVIKNIEDVTEGFDKIDGLITIKYQENIFVENVISKNQPVILLQYTNNVHIDNCSANFDEIPSSSKCSRWGITLWETENAVINNLVFNSRGLQTYGIGIEGRSKRIIVNNITYNLLYNITTNFGLVNVGVGSNIILNNIYVNTSDITKVLLGAFLSEDYDLSNAIFNNLNIYSKNSNDLSTIYSTIGNKCHLIGEIYINDVDNSSIVFNKWGEEKAITFNYNCVGIKNVVLDTYYTLRNCFIYKVCVKTPEDINITCGVINSEGGVSKYLRIGEIKKGVTYKKLYGLIDNEDDYRISFSNKKTDTEINVEVTFYVKAFSDDTFSVNSIRNKTMGPSSDRPTYNNIPTGYKYYDTTLGKFIWWNGTKWVDGNNNNADFKYSGIFSQRPSNPNVGFAYFCIDRQTSEGSTSGITIYHKGDNVWVDALGRVVS